MRGSWGSKLGYAVVLVPVAAVALVLTSKFLGDDDWVTVATIDELAEQEVVYDEDLKIYVVDREPDPLGLSAVNPHIGTYLKYCVRSGQFQGRHGEKFDRFGVYYGGPAPRNMDRVAIRVFADEVQVLPDEVTRGVPRPETGFDGREALEPTGAFCDDSPSGVGGIDRSK